MVLNNKHIFFNLHKKKFMADKYMHHFENIQGVQNY